MSQETKQDSGLARRGLFLLVLVGGIVAVVLTILFKRPAQTLPTESKQPEPFIAGLVLPGAAFPASFSWPALAKLGETLPSAAGWEVRYNAAASLARLGSSNTPWPVLAEMLDEQQQMRNFRVRLETGKVVPDEAAARLTVISALKAVKQWHEKQSGQVTLGAEQVAVHEAVERLVASPIVEVKKQAEEARTAIQAKRAG
jgi:hypothetical protein